MSNEHELIAGLLNNFQNARRRIDKETESLYELHGCAEEDLMELKSAISEFYKVNQLMTELICCVLDEKYDPVLTRKNVLKLRLMKTIQRDSNSFSAFEMFVKEKIGENSD